MTMAMRAETCCIKYKITETLSSGRRYLYYFHTYASLRHTQTEAHLYHTFLPFRLSRPPKSFDSWTNSYTVRNVFHLFVNVPSSICKTYDNTSMGKCFMQLLYQLLEFIKTGPIDVKIRT
jgi:hypothetical protein